MRDALLFLALMLLAFPVGTGCAGDDVAPGALREDESGTLLTLGPDGAGALTHETAFSPEAVGAALPDGFVLESGQIAADSTMLPVLYAFYDGQIVLEIYPDASGQRVNRIDAASDAVASPRGIRPGANFAEADGSDMDCEAGRDELSGRAVCTPEDGGPVRYVFAHGASTVPGALPDQNAMRQSILERLVWTAR